MAKRDLRKLYKAFSKMAEKYPARSFTLTEVYQLHQMAEELEACKMERLYFGLAAGYMAGVNAERNRRKAAKKK